MGVGALAVHSAREFSVESLLVSLVVAFKESVTFF